MNSYYYDEAVELVAAGHCESLVAALAALGAPVRPASSNPAWVAVILMIALFLTAGTPETRCVEGTGMLKTRATELPCLNQRTRTTYMGARAEVVYNATPDSVAYTYWREGYTTERVMMARTPDAVRKCASLHNDALRTSKRDGK
jgi:hypothetical protein